MMTRGRKKGFTMIETLVAVTVLALAVAGPLYVADRAIVSAQVSRDQLIASYLAQEAIEYLRGMRDHEYLYVRSHTSNPAYTSRDAWRAFVFGSGGDSRGTIVSCRNKSCSLDPYASLGMGVGSGYTVKLCSGTCPALRLDSSGRYNLSNGTVTPFTRTVNMTLVSLNNLRIVSTVTWKHLGNTYSATVTDNLTSWQ